MLVTFNSRHKRETESHDLATVVDDNKPTQDIPLKVVEGTVPAQNIKVIDNNNDFLFFKNSNKRSKNGCLTCKIRKKKCNEVRPVCSDCRRLSKNCIWIEPHMSELEVKLLKQKVQQNESVQKMRKRKSKPKVTVTLESATPVTKSDNSESQDLNTSKKRRVDVTGTTYQFDSSFISKPDMVNSSRTTTVSNLTDFPLGTKPDTKSVRFSKDASTIDNSVPVNNNSSHENGKNGDVIKSSSIFRKAEDLPSHLIERNVDVSHDKSTNSATFMADNFPIIDAHIDAQEPQSDEANKLSLKNLSSSANLMSFPSTTDYRNNEEPHNVANRLFSNPYSFSSLSQHYETNVNDNGIQITRVYNTNSPAKSPVPESPDLLSFFKYNKPPAPTSPSLSSLMNPVDEENESQTNQIDDSNVSNDTKTKPEDADDLVEKVLDDVSRPVFSPSLFINLLKDLKHYEPKLTLLGDDGNPQPSNDENLQGKELSKIDDSVASLSPDRYSSILNEVYSIMTPLPFTEPTYLPGLSSSTASYLYNYYEQTLSKHVSIAPKSQYESNSYQKVFLPLAHKDQGVLYAILGWAGYHLGGEWAKEGKKYTQIATNHLLKTMFGIEEFQNLPLRFNATKSTFLPTGNDDADSIIVKLATLLILCGSEICQGDVKNWSVDLSWCWKILSSNGGLLKYNSSKEGHWLLSNFAYHDLLSSSSNERGTYFPSQMYDVIFRDQEGYSRGNLNPLLGVSKKLYRIIGDISTLVYDSKKQLERYYNRDQSPFQLSSLDNSPHTHLSREDENNGEDSDDESSELSDHGRISRLLLSVIEKSKKLEQEIDTSKPDPQDLVGMTEEELELQLTLFEAFQISAKLFLRQSIMKCNPSMIECQVLNNDLIKCIDILVGSPVQASLVFPAFMAGIHSVTPHDRDLMRLRMDNFIKLYGPWNLSRAKYLMEQVWQTNVTGDSVVDWYSILKDWDWDINFA
jgi:transcriptional activator protein UGA3